MLDRQGERNRLHYRESREVPDTGSHSLEVGQELEAVGRQAALLNEVWRSSRSRFATGEQGFRGFESLLDLLQES
jgi:hypothetical protein